MSGGILNAHGVHSWDAPEGGGLAALCRHLSTLDVGSGLDAAAEMIRFIDEISSGALLGIEREGAPAFCGLNEEAYEDLVEESSVGGVFSTVCLLGVIYRMEDARKAGAFAALVYLDLLSDGAFSEAQELKVVLQRFSARHSA